MGFSIVQLLNHSRDELQAEAERFERAYGAVWAAFHRADSADDGLGQLERQVLHHIAGPTSPSEIATHLGLPRSTVTVVLQRLAGRGFVTRTRHAEDERRVVVERTSHGDSLVADDSFLQPDALKDALQRLSPTARRQLIIGLERMGRS